MRPRLRPLAALGAAFAGVVAVAGAARAHEVRPAYLALTEVAPDAWDVLWKVPAKAGARLDLDVVLPAVCRSDPARARLGDGVWAARWQTHCEGGLVGRPVAIDGLPATRTDVLVRLERDDGSVTTRRLTPEAPSFVVPAAQGPAQLALVYASLGVQHILLGPDHLLFVLALLFLVGDARRLAGTVTAFTLAHSLTLAGATLGLVRVPVAPAEAAIALSIVLVAAEILPARGGRPTLARRRPWGVAFVFGLLHGFGFAGALARLGLPERAIPLALASFNVGVELGQLAFVAAVVVLLAAGRGVRSRLGPGPRPTLVPDGSLAMAAAYGIGVLGAFWLIQRTLAMLPFAAGSGLG